MKDHSADHSHSPESGEIVRRVLAALDPKSRHHLLNEFHAIQTGLYLVDAAHRAGDDETFTRAMKQLNHAIDRLTYATEVGGDVSVEDGSDAT